MLISGHLAGLPARPDWDGVVTDMEARAWWQNGNGQPLFVNRASMDLSPVSTATFNNQENSPQSYNFFFQPKATTDMRNVYGTVQITLIDVHSGAVRVGMLNSGLIDVYDFNGDGRLARDIATWGARQIVGEGTGFRIFGYGNNPQVPLMHRTSRGMRPR